MIEKVASTACVLFRIVASMYKPFSVNALGSPLLFVNFVVENFDRKSENSFEYYFDRINRILQEFFWF